jgi:hypothetical protein
MVGGVGSPQYGGPFLLRRVRKEVLDISRSGMEDEMATKEEREAMIRPVLEQYVRKCKALGLSDEQIEAEIIEVYRAHADKGTQRRASFRTIDGDKKTPPDDTA